MNIGYNNEVSAVYQISVFRKPVSEIANKYRVSVSVVKCGIGTSNDHHSKFQEGGVFTFQDLLCIKQCHFILLNHVYLFGWGLG